MVATVLSIYIKLQLQPFIFFGGLLADHTRALSVAAVHFDMTICVQHLIPQNPRKRAFCLHLLSTSMMKFIAEESALTEVERDMSAMQHLLQSSAGGMTCFLGSMKRSCSSALIMPLLELPSTYT